MAIPGLFGLHSLTDLFRSLGFGAPAQSGSPSTDPPNFQVESAYDTAFSNLVAGPLEGGGMWIDPFLDEELFAALVLMRTEVDSAQPGVPGTGPSGSGADLGISQRWTGGPPVQWNDRYDLLEGINHSPTTDEKAVHFTATRMSIHPELADAVMQELGGYEQFMATIPPGDMNAVRDQWGEGVADVWGKRDDQDGVPDRGWEIAARLYAIADAIRNAGSIEDGLVSLGIDQATAERIASHYHATRS